MDKYFLMGLDGVNAFKDGGIAGLLDCKDNYGIIKINTRTSLIVDIMDKAIGWDGYLEIFYNDVVLIEYEKNHRNWKEFFAMIDPDANMTDGEVIDYLMKHYRVPEFIHLDQL